MKLLCHLGCHAWVKDWRVVRIGLPLAPIHVCVRCGKVEPEAHG
ncbi:MAG: hypothetical protein WA213_20855 [Terriglobales bacterium]